MTLPESNFPKIPWHVLLWAKIKTKIRLGQCSKTCWGRRCYRSKWPHRKHRGMFLEWSNGEVTHAGRLSDIIRAQKDPAVDDVETDTEWPEL